MERIWERFEEIFAHSSMKLILHINSKEQGV